MLRTRDEAMQIQCRVGGMLVMTDNSGVRPKPQMVFPTCIAHGCCHWVEVGVISVHGQERGRCGLLNPITNSEAGVSS